MPTTEIVTVQRRRKFIWPQAQLNFWWFIMMVATGFELGTFAYFMTVQSTMALGQPWLFPYKVTVGALGIFFVILVYYLSANHVLIPQIVLTGSFILFVLWLTGLIETAILLYGPNGASNNCNNYVRNEPFSGVSVGTLAYLAQMDICNLWNAAFAFDIIGVIFLVWLFIMAIQVNQDDYD